MQNIEQLSYQLDDKLFNKLFESAYLLGQVNSESKNIPQNILLNTLPLQEAKESSEIENIYTTTQELYEPDTIIKNSSTKEVKNYRKAMELGYNLVQDNQFISCNMIKSIQEMLCSNSAGFRTSLGTHIKKNDEIIYTPPQHIDDINNYMNELEHYINNKDINPIVKMSLAHYQFEKIHPFYDGNGRTGRIINILMLINDGLLDYPTLYLSRYIIKNKETYYSLLQSIHETGNFNEWIEFIADGIIQISQSTILLIQSIRNLIDEYTQKVESVSLFNSLEFVNYIFLNPVCSRQDLRKHLNTSYPTLLKYLPKLMELNILQENEIKGVYYYINTNLFELLSKQD